MVSLLSSGLVGDGKFVEAVDWLMMASLLKSWIG